MCVINSQIRLYDDFTGPLLTAVFVLVQDMLLKRAADIAEALYSVPRPHSQLQALPSSPAHGSVMGLGSYPSQLGVSIGEPGQSSQGEPKDHGFTSKTLTAIYSWE